MLHCFVANVKSQLTVTRPLTCAGYLPSFWIKLRLLAVPAINSGAVAAAVPPLLGGPTHMTVGLIATFVAVSCIIAADTGAYFCGKAFGRTQVGRGSACCWRAAVLCPGQRWASR